MSAVQESFQEIPAFIHRTSSRSRSVRISISDKGEVVVTTPPRFPLGRIHDFLRQSRGWIEKHLILHKRRVKVGDKNSLLYFGSIKTVKIAQHPRSSAVVVDGDAVIISPVQHTAESISRALIRWLKSEAEQYLIMETAKIARRMRQHYTAIQIRDQKTRWGSCSIRGNLQFNWRLVQAPKDVIDYVIMHELAHLEHMNHSRRFWDYVQEFDPNYVDHKRWLRLHGAALHQDFAFDPAVCGVA